MAFTIYYLQNSQFNQTHKAGLLTALNAALSVEAIFQPKLWIWYVRVLQWNYLWRSKAIDRLNGNTALTDALVYQFEQQTLANNYTSNNITVRSSIDVNQLQCWAILLNRERNAFFNMMGNSFKSPGYQVHFPCNFQVPNDMNPTMILYVFPTQETYIDYMGGVIGFGASAGGLYIEPSGILYTFQRFPNQSSYTVEELIFHEFGHYLHGRYIWEGNNLIHIECNELQEFGETPDFLTNQKPGLMKALQKFGEVFTSMGVDAILSLSELECISIISVQFPIEI